MSVILQFERKVEVIRQDYVIVTLFLVLGIRLKPLRNIYQRNLQSNKYGLASSSPLFSVVLYSSQLNSIISIESPKLPFPRNCRCSKTTISRGRLSEKVSAIEKLTRHLRLLE